MQSCNTLEERNRSIKEGCEGIVQKYEEVVRIVAGFRYQLLNNMIDNCAERFKTIDIPRVDYLIYKEHIYAIYAELCVVIETLLKSLLEENGYVESEIRKNGHNLNALLDEVVNIDVPKINVIRQRMKSHQSVIDYFVNNNIFVDARYMSYKEELSLMHIDMIRGLIMDLDFIYEKYYKNYDWVNILYPDTM